MLKKILKIIGALLGLIVLAGVGAVGFASYKVGKVYDVPPPPLQRATTPEALARGQHIFVSICGQCHLDDAGSARGKAMHDFPAFFGSFAAANLTSDPAGGVGAWGDGELARLIKTGIARDGTVRVMPVFKHMGDADVASLIGYMRSGAPEFAPVAERQPPSRLSVVGKVLVALVVGIDPQLKTGIQIPPEGPTAEYGQYLANGMFDCYGCHTAGFSGKKLEEPNLYGGGSEFRDLEGHTLYSPNLTPDATGLAGWTEAQFIRALREGLAPDGRILRPPMPRLRAATDLELTAVFRYLQTVPKVDRPRRQGTAPVAQASEDGKPEVLFAQLGCLTCHGGKGLFRDKLLNSVKKTPAEVARWIRNPEQFKPGTQMPTFAEVLDEPRALALAEWIQKNAQALQAP